MFIAMQTIFFLMAFLIVVVVLGEEPKALCMPGKHYAIVLHTQHLRFLWNFQSLPKLHFSLPLFLYAKELTDKFIQGLVANQE